MTALRFRRSAAPVSPHDEGDSIVTDIGLLAHKAIGEALRFGATTPDEIDALIEDLTDQHRDTYLRRRAQKVRIGAAVRSFIWWYDLRATHEPEGCEVVLPSSIADLVWRHRRTGAVLIDELKTGLPRHEDGAGCQVERHLAGGQSVFGAELVGVRVVRLRRRGVPRLHRPDGGIEAVGRELQGGLS